MAKQTLDIDLINTLSESVKKNGLRATKANLTTTICNPVQIIINLLISDICKEYKISKDILFFGSSRKVKTMAIATLVHLATTHLAIAHSDINNLTPLRYTRGRYSQLIKEVNTLDTRVPYQLEYLNKNMRIEAKMLQNIEIYLNIKNN